MRISVASKFNTRGPEFLSQILKIYSSFISQKDLLPQSFRNLPFSEDYGILSLVSISF